MLQYKKNFSHLYLIRHAESIKNLRDEHGGKGDNLSDKGIEQCKKIFHFLNNEVESPNCILYYHSNPQVEQSAKIFCLENFYEYSCDDRLKGIYLGILAGLSKDEALALDADSAIRLEQWRKGGLTIDKLFIPHAEHVSEFYTRIFTFVNEKILPNIPKHDFIIFGTRSTLIMLVNIFQLGQSFNFQNYKVYEFDSGGITRFSLYKDKSILDYINYTGYLK